MTPINQVSFGNQLRSATMQDFLAPQAYADKNAQQYVPASYSNYAPPEIVQDEGITFTTGLVRTLLTAAVALGVFAAGRKYLSAMKNLDLAKGFKETEGVLNKMMYYPAKIGEYTLEKSAKFKNWAAEKWANFRKKDPAPKEGTPSGKPAEVPKPPETPNPGANGQS